MDSTVLVKGWKKGANWSFPRGKINKDEDDLDCAIREVYEETGLDLRAADLVPTETKPKYIEISMREQHMRLYVFRNVPMDTNFEPRTRKEISKIQWYKLSELPAFRKKGGQNQDSAAMPNANKFYMVAPFLVPLKKWVVSQKKMEARRAASGPHPHLHTHHSIDEVHTEDDMWTQTDTAAETSRTPGIETIDGATLELQRLLKVQPPTQGLQPAPVPQDKGSALLSLLQAKGTDFAVHQPPHTPLDLTIGEAPQPHTPHHHSHHHAPTINTQQPPPSFPLQPNQPTAWNAPQFQAGPGQFFNQPHPLTVQQQYGNPQAGLVHPQPWPPQVQRAAFNRSTQEDPQTRYMGPPISYGNQQPTPDYASLGQLPPQPSILIDSMGHPQLNSQSAALLNAFKSNTNTVQLKENVRHPQISMSGAAQHNYPAPYPHPGMPHGQLSEPQLAENHNRSQMSPKELDGSKVGPPANDHRSALLGMFRKAEPAANTEQAHFGQVYGSGPSPSMSAQAPVRVAGDGAQSLTLESLFIKSRPDVPAVRPPQDIPDHGPQVAQPMVQRAPQPTQPIRILQRGQSELPAEVMAQPVASPRVSPHALAGQLASNNLTSPPTAASLPIPVAVNRPPEAGHDQKRQLLSLFGKQRQSPASLEVAKGKEVVTETPRTRVSSLAVGHGESVPGSSSSSRRESQTPISPAERSFLLGYLESVTNNATR